MSKDESHDRYNCWKSVKNCLCQVSRIVAHTSRYVKCSFLCTESIRHVEKKKILKIELLDNLRDSRRRWSDLLKIIVSNMEITLFTFFSGQWKAGKSTLNLFMIGNRSESFTKNDQTGFRTIWHFWRSKSTMRKIKRQYLRRVYRRDRRWRKFLNVHSHVLDDCRIKMSRYVA